MAEPKEHKATDLGLYARREEGLPLPLSVLIPAGLSLVWLFGITLFILYISRDSSGDASQVDGLRFVMAIIAIFMPVALIWVAATAVRSGRIMKEESTRLQAAINAMRHSFIQQQQSGVLGIKPAVEQKLDDIAAAQRQTEATIATFTSIRPETEQLAADERSAIADARASSPPEQPSLALGTPSASHTPPLTVTDFIRALHFPETAEDKEGFRALRRALHDRNTSQLIQAAQDVLTLISQDGIYMDDLHPDRARPETWRRFAKGERGKTMAALGGIRDRSSLALVAGRMRQDTIFRDSVHHFLRKFDHVLCEFEKTASDQDLALMTDTRTARAFMLLGRVTGTFD